MIIVYVDDRTALFSFNLKVITVIKALFITALLKADEISSSLGTFFHVTDQLPSCFRLPSDEGDALKDNLKENALFQSYTFILNFPIFHDKV